MYYNDADEKILKATYLSYNEFVDDIINGPVTNPDYDRYHYMRPRYTGPKAPDPPWLGFKQSQLSKDHLVDMLESGWQEGVDMIENARQEIEPPQPRCVRRRLRWGDNGDEVDMQRVWTGRLDEAWRQSQKPVVQGPTRVTIAVDTIACGFEDPGRMKWRGVAACVLADALMSAGYSVKIVSAFRGKQQETVVCRSIIKDYTSPFDDATLSACAVSPSYFRYFGHAWGVRKLSMQYCGDGGYYPLRLQVEDVEDLADDGQLYLVNQSIGSKKAATQWVEDSVNEIENNFSDTLTY